MYREWNQQDRMWNVPFPCSNGIFHHTQRYPDPHLHKTTCYLPKLIILAVDERNWIIWLMFYLELEQLRGYQFGPKIIYFLIFIYKSFVKLSTFHLAYCKSSGAEFHCLAKVLWTDQTKRCTLSVRSCSVRHLMVIPLKVVSCPSVYYLDVWSSCAF